MFDGLSPARPRILLLTPQRPVQHGNGSRVRTYHVARALSRIGDVHLIQLPRHDRATVPPDVQPFLKSLRENPHAEKPRRGNTARKRRRLARRSVLSPWSLDTMDWLMEVRRSCLGSMEIEPFARRRDTLARSLRAHALLFEVGLSHSLFGVPPTDSIQVRATAEHVLPLVEDGPAARGIDIIWLEHSHLLTLLDPLRRRFPNARTVCNAHNVLSRLHDGHAPIMTSAVARRWHRVEAAACRRLERSGFAAVDRVYACSEQDKARILQLAPGADVRVWPNGVETAFFLPAERPVGPPLLLLPGSMNYMPNSHGANWFAREILPRVRAEVPDCRLRIAGRGADQTCSVLAEADPSIDVLGEVPDMRPHFAAATAVIVPLRAGSGTRLKILEAMSMKRAVVSTTIGAEGLGDDSRSRLLLADSEQAFADAIVSIVKDRELRERLERNGREFVQERYDWEMMGNQALAAR